MRALYILNTTHVHVKKVTCHTVIAMELVHGDVKHEGCRISACLFQE